MTRLEKAMAYFNEKVSKAEPSFACPLFEIKENILYTIFEEVFDENPTPEENEWWETEMKKVSVYLNTEYF